MRCGNCGNADVFITEKLFLHWVEVDGEGRVISVDDLQGDGSEGIDPRSAHLECAACNSEEVYGD